MTTRRPPTDPLTLAFVDPRLEVAYRAWFADRTLGYLRGCAVLLPLLYAAFGPVDALVAPARVEAVWTMRYAVAVPALCAFLAPLWLPRARPWLARRLQEVLAVQAAVALGCLLAIGAIELPVTGREFLETSTMGLLVAMSFVHGLSRLRFAYAVPVGLAFTLAALGLLLAHPARTGWLVAACVFYGAATNAIGAWISWSLERSSRDDFAGERELEQARARADALLHAALPPSVAQRLRAADRPTFAERHPDVTVVLADVAGFTPLAGRLPEVELAALLDALFTRFDALCVRHGAVKVKTLGDGWLACLGAPDPHPDAPAAAAALARDMLAAVDEVRRRVAEPLGLRIGIATGSVVAGVIGRRRHAWDLWGEALREAAAMEQGGAVGRVRLAAATARRLPPERVAEEAGAHWLRV